MTYGGNLRTEGDGPCCQATGCFQKASFYVVLKETEQADYYELSGEANDYKSEKYSMTRSHEVDATSDLNFDGFKMIMHFCTRHENDFKYLIRGSELRVSKSCRLCVSRDNRKIRH
jgi:hypothetical protein